MGVLTKSQEEHLQRLKANAAKELDDAKQSLFRHAAPKYKQHLIGQDKSVGGDTRRENGKLVYVADYDGDGMLTQKEMDRHAASQPSKLYYDDLSPENLKTAVLHYADNNLSSNVDYKMFKTLVDQAQEKYDNIESNYLATVTVAEDIKKSGKKPTPEQQAKLNAAAKAIGADSYNGLGIPYSPETAAAEQVAENETEEQKAKQSVIKPELGEQIYNKIMEAYIGLKKSTTDQHVLAMFTDAIMTNRFVRETWPRLDANGKEFDTPSRVSQNPTSDAILSLSNNIDTDSIHNAFGFKLKDVVDTDYEGFLVNPLHTLSSAQLASLTPKIDMFIRNKDTKQLTRIPLQDTENSIAGKTGLAAYSKLQSVFGIKELSIRMAGKDPQTAKRDIECTATFYGNNLSVFNNEKFAQIIRPYEKNKSGEAVQLSMHVGWNTPSPKARETLGFTAKQIDAIQKQRKVYIMYYYKHSFSFNADGSFTLVADYVSALDEMMEDINIMADSEDVVENFYELLASTDDEGRKLTTFAEKAVNDYVETVHPTVTDNTRYLIFKFFKTRSEADIPKYIKKHTDYFAKRDSLKVARITNYLLENNKMFKASINGYKYNRDLFAKAFERVLAPHFLELSFDGESQMPKHIYEGSVKKYHRLCNMKGSVFNKSQDESVIEVGSGRKRRFAVSQLATRKLEDGTLEFVETDTEYTTVGKKKPGSPEEDSVKKITESNEFSEQGGDKAKEEAKKNARKIEEAQGGVGGDGKKEAVDEEKVKARVAKEEARIKNRQYDIYFFQFGDVVNAVIQTCGGADYLFNSQAQILFGNINIGLDVLGKEVRYPIYKLPIALSTFQNVIKKFQESTSRRFPLRKFINEMMIVLINHYANGDYVLDSTTTRESFALKSAQIHTTTKGVSDLIGSYNLSDVYKSEVAAKGRNPSSSQDARYLYFYSISPSSTTVNNVTARNITKFELGNQNSIIKKISYSQVENPVLKAKQDDNVVAAHKSSQGGLIPQMYNVDLTTFGNITIEPGYEFFIKPSVVGISHLNWSPIFRDVGLTAVLKVIKSEHRLSPEGFETTFSCISVSPLDWSEAIGKLKQKGKRESAAERRKAEAWSKNQPKKVRTAAQRAAFNHNSGVLANARLKGNPIVRKADDALKQGMYYKYSNGKLTMGHIPKNANDEQRLKFTMDSVRAIESDEQRKKDAAKRGMGG